MQEITPAFLLRNPSLVQVSAPWCRLLDNLELGILLLTQPWIVGDGQRRADLERGLARLDADMPVGPVYFQRVSRSVAALEESGALAGSGEGRARRFAVTPEGFAALILNLHVLTEDPTLDARELEFKRSLVAIWNVLLDRIGDLADEIELDEAWEAFLERVEQVTVLGRRVITEEILRQALDVQRLIADQRANVQRLRAAAQARLQQVATEAEILRNAEVVRFLAEDPEALEVLQNLAFRTVPELGIRARILRYDAFLGYLDKLSGLYTRELKVVDLQRFRRRLGGENV